VDIGKLETALENFGKAAEHGEDSAEFNHDFAMALSDNWEYDAAVIRFTRAVELKPDYAQAFNNLGNTYIALRQPEQALEMYERAVKLAPGVPEAVINVATTFDNLGQYNKSLTRYRRIAKNFPSIPVVHYHLAKALLATGNAKQALISANQFLRKHPTAQDGIALKAVLLKELGRNEASEKLLNFDRFIRKFEMPLPAGYQSIDKFNDDLATHVLFHATNRLDPYGSSTNNGLHSQNILDDDIKPIRALKAWLQTIFREYVEKLPIDQDHPFLSQEFPECRITAQAQLLNSSGFLDSHIHPVGRVSGAYYISLPETISDTETKAGWIEFGRPPDDIKNMTEPDVYSVQPLEGMAVLFPSYFYHGTRPFKSSKRRVSLGIDLIPV
jgi:tetratricopeptide (TPR) repeat protein